MAIPKNQMLQLLHLPQVLHARQKRLQSIAHEFDRVGARLTQNLGVFDVIEGVGDDPVFFFVGPTPKRFQCTLADVNSPDGVTLGHRAFLMLWFPNAEKRLARRCAAARPTDLIETLGADFCEIQPRARPKEPLAVALAL
jgi:hypothetical protein